MQPFHVISNTSAYFSNATVTEIYETLFIADDNRQNKRVFLHSRFSCLNNTNEKPGIEQTMDVQSGAVFSLSYQCKLGKQDFGESIYSCNTRNNISNYQLYDTNICDNLKCSSSANKCQTEITGDRLV